MSHLPYDLTWLRFGRLTVLGAAIRSERRRSTKWACICDCGNFSVVETNSLVSGKTKSCRCLSAETTSRLLTIHGHARPHAITAEYRSYQLAKHRCNNSRAHNYRWYGARGIKFLFANFSEFIAELGQKPTPKHSVDRINTDGHYEKGNVRWATPKEQVENRRCSIKRKEPNESKSSPRVQ